MKLIPELGYTLDLAILPIGDNFTMGIEEAAMAAKFVQCNTVMGYHYDTFPPIALDQKKAKAHFSAQGLELLLPAIGENHEI